MLIFIISIINEMVFFTIHFTQLYFHILIILYYFINIYFKKYINYFIIFYFKIIILSWQLFRSNLLYNIHYCKKSPIKNIFKLKQ